MARPARGLRRCPTSRSSRATQSEPLPDADGRRVRGVRVRRRDGSGTEEDCLADLVVETAGRGSHVPKWLDAMGYQPAPEETVVIDLGYATRTYRRPPQEGRDWQMLIVYAHAPDGTRMGIVSPIEGDRWIVTLAGCLKDYPPDDDAGFLDFAREPRAARPVRGDQGRDAVDADHDDPLSRAAAAPL